MGKIERIDHVVQERKSLELHGGLIAAHSQLYPLSGTKPRITGSVDDFSDTPLL